METPKTLAPAQIEMLGQGRYSDLAVPGLCLKVDDKGRRTWWYRRRIARAKTIITKQLGAFPAFSIAAARQWAMELNEATQRGENPLAIQRAEAARAAMTLDKAHQAYIAAIRRGDRKKLRPRTISDKQGIYGRDIGPRLGAKLLSELTENDCWDAVYDKAKGSRYRANKIAGS